MTYKEIRKLSKKSKKSHTKYKMGVERYPNFSVMYSDKTGGILVDNDIAEKASERRWCIDSGGYPIANFDGCLIRLFDYVLAQQYKSRPKSCYVDHINQDKLDNRRTNLRFVTPLESSHNMPIKSDNTSGVTGVSKTKNGKYRAYITINQKQVSLGHYSTLKEAAEARLEAESRFGFKSRPGNIDTLCKRRTQND